jgi:SAM-dependent methyltransferase
LGDAGKQEDGSTGARQSENYRRPMSTLRASWSSFSPEIAKVYLDGYGSPSERSKILMVSLLREQFGESEFRLADFGCGNGHLCSFFQQAGLTCDYYGYDFSTSLLDAARERHADNPRAHFLEADIEDPELSVTQCDVTLYSHVLEMLQSPQRSLMAARKTSPLVMIRFFEPPDGQFDITELRQMAVSDSGTVPYLRRTMSSGYYNLILNEVGCRSVDVHLVEGDKDQIHVLRFAQAAVV